MRITQRGRIVAVAAFFVLVAASVHNTITAPDEQPAHTCYASVQECADMVATINGIDN